MEKTDTTPDVKPDEVKNYKVLATEADAKKYEQSLKSQGKNELLKELEIESVESYKKSKKEKEQMKENEKTEVQKLAEQLEALQKDNSSQKAELRKRDVKDAIANELDANGYDSKYAAKIQKLIGTDNVFKDGQLNREQLKELVEKEAADLDLIKKDERKRIKIGDELDTKDKPVHKVADKLAKKYPWLNK